MIYCDVFTDLDDLNDFVKQHKAIVITIQDSLEKDYYDTDMHVMYTSGKPYKLVNMLKVYYSLPDPE